MTTNVSPSPPARDENDAPPGGGGGGAGGEQVAQTSPDLRSQILAAIGVGEDGLTGPHGRMIGTTADMLAVGRWIAAGMTEREVIDVVAETMSRKGDGPPSSFGYFDQPMARFVSEKGKDLAPFTSSRQKGGADHEPLYKRVLRERREGKGAAGE